jgi:hypothetical protein
MSKRKLPFTVGERVRIIDNYLLRYGVPKGTQGTVQSGGGHTDDGRPIYPDSPPDLFGCWVLWHVSTAHGDGVWGTCNFHLRRVRKV